ncbi:hypothetical protein P3T73_12440 [Kiritimatiellota bacterium B12222]|nr:hypothetical protein P3T73_12440 [Kiritimatiellota bacterium B12222]
MTLHADSRYLSTYYFHGQDLCMVPRHVREDIAWMVEHHVDGVFVGVHDSDLRGGNTQMVCDIIREAGLDVWLIPSRIGGLVAGWGRQPSYLSVEHPEWWSRKADGRTRGYFGPEVSVFHPEVPDAVAETVLKMLEKFPATGMVWDELKTLEGEDHSQAAIDALGHPADEKEMLSGTVNCFSKINQRLKQTHPDLKIASFIYANSSKEHIESCAAIDLLDQFGCDGKCYKPGESAVGEGGEHKVLMGGIDAQFAATARENDCTPFTLLETQLLDEATLEISLSRMPEYLPTKTGHLVYYYYPYGLANPEHYMPIIGKNMADWRRGAL